MSNIDGAGGYILKKFEISDFMGNTRTVDITNEVGAVEAKLLMGEWSLNESLNSSCLNGMAQILDGVGLFYDFPLRGEERLTIVYEDFFGEERTEDMFIHSVSNVMPAKENSADLLTYTIHFVSASKFVSDTAMVRRGFSGLISDMVTEAFGRYFTQPEFGTEKTINVTPTEGIQNLIVPNFNGTEMMNFFARHAFGGTSTFRFYENRDGYHFSNNEAIIENAGEATKFFYNIKNDKSAAAQIDKMNSIVDIQFGQPVDTLSDLYTGSYHKRATELNYINREATINDYDYSVDFPEYNNGMGYAGANLKPNHTPEFVSQFLRAGKNMLMIQDYPGAARQNAPALRPKTFHGEAATESWAVTQQHKHNTIQIKIFGRNDIVAGSMVELDLDEFRPAPSAPDRKTSGLYLVESVSNEFMGSTYMQSLVVSRGGISE